MMSDDCISNYESDNMSLCTDGPHMGYKKWSTWELWQYLFIVFNMCSSGNSVDALANSLILFM